MCVGGGVVCVRGSGGERGLPSEMVLLGDVGCWALMSTRIFTKLTTTTKRTTTKLLCLTSESFSSIQSITDVRTVYSLTHSLTH